MVDPVLLHHHFGILHINTCDMWPQSPKSAVPLKSNVSYFSLRRGASLKKGVH